MRLTLLSLLAIAGCALSACNTNTNNVADLTIPSTPTVSPAAPVAGTTITVTVPISNIGSADAGAFNYTVNRDGTPDALTGQATSSGLTQGSSSTFTFTVTESTSGDHTYIVLINPSGGITESNYQNNSKTLTVTFTAATPAARNG